MSAPEETLAFQLRAMKIPFEREVVFAKPRKFRADFRVHGGAWNSQSLLVEVEGGAFVGGRHVRGSGFRTDCEKASLAAVNGYRVVRCLPEQVDSGECLAWIERALGLEKAA